MTDRVLRDFSPGLRLDLDPDTLPDGATPDAHDVLFPRGRVQVRPGIARHTLIGEDTSIPSGPRSLHEFTPINGDPARLVYAIGNTVYSTLTADQTADTSQQLTTLPSATVPVRAVQHGEHLYLMDGTSVVKRAFNTVEQSSYATRQGPTATQATPTPIALAVHSDGNERLYILDETQKITAIDTSTLAVVKVIVGAGWILPGAVQLVATDTRVTAINAGLSGAPFFVVTYDLITDTWSGSMPLGTAAGEITAPLDLARDQVDGSLWVLDADYLHHLAADGTFIARVAHDYGSVGHIAVKLAVTPDSLVVGLSSSMPRIVLLTRTGNLLGQWALPGRYVDQVGDVYAIAYKSNTNTLLVATQAMGYQIKEFTLDGREVFAHGGTKLGSTTSGYFVGFPTLAARGASVWTADVSAGVSSLQTWSIEQASSSNYAYTLTTPLPPTGLPAVALDAAGGSLGAGEYRFCLASVRVVGTDLVESALGSSVSVTGSGSTNQITITCGNGGLDAQTLRLRLYAWLPDRADFQLLGDWLRDDTVGEYTLTLTTDTLLPTDAPFPLGVTRFPPAGTTLGVPWKQRGAWVGPSVTEGGAASWLHISSADAPVIIADPDSVATPSTIDGYSLEPLDGQPITALHPLGGYLSAWSYSSMTVLGGDNALTYYPVPVTGAPGCLRQEAMTPIRGAVAWVSEQSVWLMSDNLQLTDIGQAIADAVQGMDDTQRAGVLLYATPDARRLVLVIPSHGRAPIPRGTAYVYDLDEGWWAPGCTRHPNDAVCVNYQAATPGVYAADAYSVPYHDNGALFRLWDADQHADDLVTHTGLPIPWAWADKPLTDLNGGALNTRKLNTQWAGDDGQSVTLAVEGDGVETSTVKDVPTSGVVRWTLPRLASAITTQLRVSGTATGELSLHALAAKFTRRGPTL